MSPLVRHQPRGYAAPPVPVPWWETTVAYVLVMLGVIAIALGFFFDMSLLGCENSPYECPEILDQVRDGTVGSVRSGVEVLLVVGVLAGVAVHFLAGKLHFAIVWALAALPLVFGVLAIGWTNGIWASPWGQL